MRRLSAALIIVLVMLGATPSYAVNRDDPGRGRESIIVKIIRSITRLFQPRPDDEISQPKP